MSLEGPAMVIVVARLAQPEVNLAAWGGVVFPLCLIVEAPIIMLLAASTALCKDWASFRRVYRFTMAAGASLTGVHALIAFTPLYYFIASTVIGVPTEVVGPARWGLMLMLPWTWAIAYRRFHQGVLIRFGHSGAVGIGTLVRLGTEVAMLTLGYLRKTIPGIVVAGAATACGVVGEAIYVGLRARPVVRDQVRWAAPAGPPPTLRSFLAFYVPLSLTSLLYMLSNPMASMALSRMPRALDSLAAWPAVSGLVFLLRSLGMAYNEVVVALLGEPHAIRELRRFTLGLTAATTMGLVLVTATPLSRIWFGPISGLSPALASLAQLGLWLALPMPGLNALQSWFQGAIVHSRRTRGITEATGTFLFFSLVVLGTGVLWKRMTGLYVGLASFSLGGTMQTLWLWFRSRPALAAAPGPPWPSEADPPESACPTGRSRKRSRT